MKFSRRQALAATALVPAAPLWAKKRKPTPPTVPSTDPFEGMASTLLALLPETATYNGTADALAGGPLARQMDDYSPAGEAKIRAAYVEAKAKASAMHVSGERAQLQQAVVVATLENGTRSAAVPYGKINPFHFAGHVPYMVTQLYGPHIEGLNIMMEQQSLQTPIAVDAWIEKLDSFPQAFGGVVEKIRADRAAGCVPPRVLRSSTP
jgi:uncharacterized protein (DUF885 family)